MSSWYYSSNGKEFGPISIDELRAYISSKSIPSDKFRGPGMSNWVFASEVEPILKGHPVGATEPSETPAVHLESSRGSAGTCIAIGALSFLIGMYFLLVNPSQEVAGTYPLVDGMRLANIQRLILGQTFSLIGAIFIAVGIRPRS